MRKTPSGFAASVLAYLLWGFITIYWKQLTHFNAFELIGHRILWSSVLKRFPKLRIALSEGGIGWIPYFLERADYVLMGVPLPEGATSVELTFDRTMRCSREAAARAVACACGPARHLRPSAPVRGVGRGPALPIPVFNLVRRASQ